MFGKLASRGKRACLCKRDRIVDLCRNLGLHGSESTRVEQAVGLKQVFVQLDRAARYPVVKLFLRAVAEAYITERPAMLDPAICHKLDQGRPAIPSHPGNGIAR